MLLLTSGSNIRCDTTYSVRQISLSAAPENGKRAVRFPFTFLRCRERTHECTNGNATNFATIKHHRSIIFFFFYHARGTRERRREKLRLSVLSDLCSSSIHTKCHRITSICTYVCPLGCNCFIRDRAHGTTSTPSPRKWTRNFASILCSNNACTPRDIPRSDLIWSRNKPDWHAVICSA